MTTRALAPLLAAFFAGGHVGAGFCQDAIRARYRPAQASSLVQLNLRHAELAAGAVSALVESSSLGEISCIPDEAPVWWPLELMKEREGRRVLRINDRFELLLPLGLSRQMEFP